MNYEIKTGNNLDILKTMDDESVNCVVTSPPYWGLRDYGTAEQLGLESTPEEYVANMVKVFGQVKRVLRDDGTLWLNLGDSYAHSLRQSGKEHAGKLTRGSKGTIVSGYKPLPIGLKEKDLVGIPWRVALALQADGWYLRQDIIWHKPNPMPESVTDRCTKAHEYIFLLSKNKKYYYDHEAIKEPQTSASLKRQKRGVSKNNKWIDGANGQTPHNTHQPRDNDKNRDVNLYKNKRSVWTVNTAKYREAHFAVYPKELIEPCILAGCPEDGTVLDPFSGSGTTGIVAVNSGRKYIGLELNPEYAELSLNRIQDECPNTLTEFMV